MSNYSFMYQTFLRLLIGVGRTAHQGLLTNRYPGQKLWS